MRTISLVKLRQGDTNTVKLVCETLRQDGFIFFDLTGDADLSSYDFPLEQAASFLSQHKGQAPAQALHGHVSNAFKDSLRILTGNQYEKSSSPLDLRPLAKTMDRAAMDVAASLAKPLFDCDDGGIYQLGEKYNLPLPILQPESHQSPPSYGLLDIVLYHNDDDDNSDTPEMIVSPHQDPGLLILSLPQSAPGLELQDADGNWHEPPPGQGILWTGSAAADKVRPCPHRVRTYKGKPRLACWHEICTSLQISQPMLDQLEEEQRELQMGNVTGTNQVLDILRTAENHGFSSQGCHHLAIVEVEPFAGVPMFKVEQATFAIPVRKPRQRGIRLPGGFQFSWSG